MSSLSQNKTLQKYSLLQPITEILGFILFEALGEVVLVQSPPAPLEEHRQQPSEQQLGQDERPLPGILLVRLAGMIHAGGEHTFSLFSRVNLLSLFH